MIEKDLYLSNFTIYHNPRCSKSRLTLELLKDKGIDPKVILYLETPPSEKELVLILKKLNMEARELLRKGEAEFKEQNLSDASKSEEDIIQAMVHFPKLMERP
ncbi:MAG TPA: arsenate reductase (glutaredoxin), partial [Gammaproteobacteria bacterium]|nr:arsenate reductase (glutaredoxin) [Gammaproteobacteria bacterium]